MNFCFESLGTTISSDQDGEDEFQVSNLLKYSNQLSTLLLAPVPTPTLPSTSSASLVQYSNTNNNAKGFMTAHFVRPPVKIKLHFPVPIEISHIVICPRVGKQCSSGFQLEAVITGRVSSLGLRLNMIRIAQEELRNVIKSDVFSNYNCRRRNLERSSHFQLISSGKNLSILIIPQEMLFQISLCLKIHDSN